VTTPRSTATEYRPLPRVVLKCFRCRLRLADCSCYDEYWARWAS